MQDLPLSIVAVPRMRGSAFAFSFATQAVMLLLLVKLGFIQPQRILEYKHFEAITLTTTMPERSWARPAIVKVAQPAQPVDRPLVASLPRPERMPKPQAVKPPEFERLNISRPELAEVTTAPVRMSAPVQTGVFSSGSSAKPTLNLPAREVQTGGFGDPNGVRGQGTGNAKLVVASLGEFDLPGGSGWGNGTGGAHGARGTVASAGFGNGVATQHPGTGNGANRARIAQAGFGDARPPLDTPRAQKPAPAAAAPITPVEIISKPKPAYTEQARRQRIEGEVLLEVLFPVTGEPRVLRVIRGLGYGLDESAVRAAQQIRYRPALREGQAVDFTSTIHVMFAMAY